jgi:hypothetical protein
LSKKLTEDQKIKRREQRKHKKKIEQLAYKAYKGNKKAESELEKEFLNNPSVKKLIESLIKAKWFQKQDTFNQPKGNLANSRPTSGNLFKLFSGGAPK